METEKEALPKSNIVDGRLATEYLANERTFLAWIRTCIAVISLGFVVARFSLWLNQLAISAGINKLPVRAGTSLEVGIGMMFLGGVLSILALLHYQAVNRMIKTGQVRESTSLMLMVTIVTTILAAIMIVYMYLTRGAF